jgi:membrane protein
MVSLVFDTVLQALGKMWGTDGWEVVAQWANTLITFALTTVVFAMIYKLMPRAKIAWHDVWVGAAVTAVLFAIGKFLIGLYIGRSAVASSFGAAGALAVVMVWVYYSAQVFLLGAEFTWVYAHSHGSRKSKPVEEKKATDSPAAVEKPAPVRSEARAPKRRELATLGVAAALGAVLGIASRRMRGQGHDSFWRMRAQRHNSWWRT